MDRAELEVEQRLELLLHLFKLDCKLGQTEEALEHLALAWELAEEPTPELLEALTEIDQAKLPEDSPARAQMHRMELAAAIQRDDPPAAVAAAQALAATGDEGREHAITELTEYEPHASDSGPVLR